MYVNYLLDPHKAQSWFNCLAHEFCAWMVALSTSITAIYLIHLAWVDWKEKHEK
jgi:hypothetical protein